MTSERVPGSRQPLRVGRHHPVVGALVRRFDWLEQGTAYFLAEVTRPAPTDDPTEVRLPGWSRSHVIAHVDSNARAIMRLARWARTGIESPMYESQRARDDEIERGAARSPIDLARSVTQSAEELNESLRALPSRAWSVEVRTIMGRTVPATEIVWMRVREVWIHAVDLRPDAGFGSFPGDLLAALVTDITGLFARRGELLGLTLESTTSADRWSIGEHTAESTVVRAPLAAIAGWLTGRATGTVLGEQRNQGPLPAVPRWI